MVVVCHGYDTRTRSGDSDSTNTNTFFFQCQKYIQVLEVVSSKQKKRKLKSTNKLFQGTN